MRLQRLKVLARIVSGIVLIALVGPPALQAQTTPYSEAEIKRLIADFKEDPRGPFQAIRWFCPDGSVIGARERCAQPGGIQHALHKDVVARLQLRNGVYLGQILAGTSNEAFLDEPNYFSRLKQYQLEQFLVGVDDGWILRKARFYRGAYQAEDEEAWGKQFLQWALGRDALVEERFFTLREAVRDIPHEAADNLVQRIRAVSREISDEYPAFLDLRVKIHGQPASSDTVRVLAFRQQHGRKMPAPVAGKMDRLLDDMRRQYATDHWARLRTLAGQLPATSRIRESVLGFDARNRSVGDQVRFLSDVLSQVRESMGEVRRGNDRLKMLDLSLSAENLLFTSISEWHPKTVGESLTKARALIVAAYGTGLLEQWEWLELRGRLDRAMDVESYPVGEFEALVNLVRSAVEWGIGMVSATYGEVVELYHGFESLADGFLDDRMRSTVLLPLGEELGRLSDLVAARSGRTNQLMGLASTAGLRGLNAGIAVGELVVVPGSAEHLEFNPNKIYVVGRAPADLKPVAGIATVSEGNVVSHVQLLARNLGIPNAVVSPQSLRQLERMSGRRVFYAVSPGGVVRMKPAEEMSAEERALVEQRRRSEERIAVPIDRLELENTRLESVYELRARDSGTVCGPKAANLGQLSSLFPGRVAPGFIVPFGVFRRHMDQPMPAAGQSYWEFLRDTFRRAAERREKGDDEVEIETEVLTRLATLRDAIGRMPLQSDFVAELRGRFRAVLGGPIGSVPVFVRSDTNMEDLKDFTGAGLNLTVPNVVSEDDILQAVRRVWASPYRERGYGWRQKYLLNPEDVYPSLLILRSVNVQKSGVMITTGISSGRRDEVTVAFNRGVGGAVDGQAAEVYLLATNRTLLESPAREPRFTTLPARGGVEKRITAFNERILSPSNLDALWGLALEIRRKLPGTPGIETDGPFDVELGFESGQIRLFQTRPFVENKSAASTIYLTAMDKRKTSGGRIRLSDGLAGSGSE